MDWSWNVERERRITYQGEKMIDPSSISRKWNYWVEKLFSTLFSKNNIPYIRDYLFYLERDSRTSPIVYIKAPRDTDNGRYKNSWSPFTRSKQDGIRWNFPLQNVTHQSAVSSRVTNINELIRDPTTRRQDRGATFRYIERDFTVCVVPNRPPLTGNGRGMRRRKINKEISGDALVRRRGIRSWGVVRAREAHQSHQYTTSTSPLEFLLMSTKRQRGR